MIVVDTSAIVAYMNAGDDRHDEVGEWLSQVEDDLVTTPLIIAEVDHLIGSRGGRSALRALYDDLRSGAYLVEWWEGAIADTVRVAERYADTGLGLADASLVTLASRHQTVSIASLDERHFRALRPVGLDMAFRLLPMDAEP